MARKPRKRPITPIQAGFGGNHLDYIDLRGALDLNVAAHDATDDVMVSVVGQVDGEPAWVDIEMDFDNAKRLIEELQDAIDRKSPHTQFIPS